MNAAVSPPLRPSTKLLRPLRRFFTAAALLLGFIGTSQPAQAQPATPTLSFGGLTLRPIGAVEVPLGALPKGTLDSGFDAGSISGGSPIRGVAVQPDGKVLIVGNFSAVAGISRSTVARLNRDGSVDTAFV